MKFSFTKNYRFRCKKCGACCNQRALSLTDGEFEWLKNNVDSDQYELLYKFYPSPDIPLNEVALNKGSRCLFYSKADPQKTCTIYNSRFFQCVMYPLSFSAFPDGELLVNVLHCKGVSITDGEIINEEFVEKLLEKNKQLSLFINNWINFYQDRHSQLLPFYFNPYDRTEFQAKRFFLEKISNWIAQPHLKNHSIEVRIEAVTQVVHKCLYDNMGQLARKLNSGPILFLTFSDIENFALKIQKEMELNFISKCIVINKKKQRENKRILSKGEVQLLNGGKPRDYKMNEKISCLTPDLEKIGITVEEVIREKPFSNDADQLLNDYLEELCHRIGRGGIQMSFPVYALLETFYHYSKEIMLHALVYSQHSKSVEEHHIQDAITVLDSRDRIGDIFKKVLEDGF